MQSVSIGQGWSSHRYKKKPEISNFSLFPYQMASNLQEKAKSYLKKGVSVYFIPWFPIKTPELDYLAGWAIEWTLKSLVYQKKILPTLTFHSLQPKGCWIREAENLFRQGSTSKKYHPEKDPALFHYIFLKQKPED